MNIPRIALVFALGTLAGPMVAADVAPPAEVQKATENDAAALLLEAARSPEKDFFTAYDAARDAGVSEGKLIQARLVKALVGGDARGLIGMIDKIEEHRVEFDIGFDPKQPGKYVFSCTREVDGFLHALKALKAYQDDDELAFETHAMSAFGLWPRWAQTFQLGQLLEQKRFAEVTRDYVAHLTLPLDTPLRDLDGKALALADVVEGHKAVLLDFWASWCGPCMRAMPELQRRAQVLPPQGVAVVAVNTDEESPLEKARKIQEEKHMEMSWLVEADDRPLSQALFVDSIPRAVLIAADGRVLFSGHPADDGLVKALSALGVDESKSPPPDLTNLLEETKIALPQKVDLPAARDETGAVAR